MPRRGVSDQLGGVSGQFWLQSADYWKRWVLLHHTVTLTHCRTVVVEAAAAKMNEPEVCYILDAILFVYGIVLTALYCHLKIKTSREKKKNPTPALYEPLSYPSNQIYSKIGKGEGGVEMKVRNWEEKVITLVSALQTRLRMKL
ncbi:high affinity immunoglobulin epsilon receptor subunit gamma isoform X2 [Aquarana catesbeiana]|uniref:high affinity immunoglobulin epsilon receptor subunit gamma isoform X2 n=1 Tax=Aquarana catesbeiana TaxID=8400 RepID=UPI003CC96A03